MMIPILAALAIVSPPSITVKVDGEGCMRFVQAGRVVYAKEAQLTVVEGRLCSSGGLPIIPSVTLSGDGAISIDLQGNIMAGKNSVSRLVLALFPDESALTPQGAILISADRPRLSNPGEGTAGVIRIVVQASSPVPTKIQTSRPIVKPDPRPATSKQIVVTVRSSSTVEAKTFALGDIAEIVCPPELLDQIKSIAIGDSPPMGTFRGIDQTRVLARIKMAGFKADQWKVSTPTGAKVVRDGLHIAHDAFVSTARQAVRDQLGITAEMASPVPAPEMVVPRGELRLVAESVAGTGAKASVVVGVYVDSKRINSRTVTLTGSPGAVMVKSGSTVKLRMVSSGAVVEVLAKAKTSGGVGQTIEVQTITGVTFTGVVLANGSVEVKL